MCSIEDESSGDSATDSIAVEVHPYPTVSAIANRSVASPGEEITFTATSSGGVPNFTYSWGFGDGNSANGQSVTHAYQEAGQYTATVNVRDAVAGVASNSVSVTVSQAPAVLRAEATATALQTHVGTAITFACKAFDGTTPYSFEWNFGDAKGPSEAVTSHAYASPGTKTATCTVRDGAGDTATSQVTINVYALPAAVIGVDHPNASPGTLITFTATATGGSGQFTYNWDLGEGMAQGPAVTHAYERPGRYTVVVTVQDSIGGTAPITVSLTVTVSDVKPVAIPSTSSGQTGDPITFSAVASGGAGEPYIFSWEFGDGGKGEGAMVSHEYSIAGTYTPRLTVTDGAGASREMILAPITIRAPPTQPSSSSSAFSVSSAEFAIGSVVGFTLAAAIAVSLFRRRRSGP